MFVLFDMFCMFNRLVSETPHKLPEFKGVAIQKASYLSEDPIKLPDLISVN